MFTNWHQHRGAGGLQRQFSGWEGQGGKEDQGAFQGMGSLIDGNNKHIAQRLPKKRVDVEEDVGRRKGEGEIIWHGGLKEGIPCLQWRPEEKLQKWVRRIRRGGGGGREEGSRDVRGGGGGPWLTGTSSYGEWVTDQLELGIPPRGN